VKIITSGMLRRTASSSASNCEEKSTSLPGRRSNSRRISNALSSCPWAFGYIKEGKVALYEIHRRGGKGVLSEILCDKRAFRV
jgi:hypothetical protein